MSEECSFSFISLFDLDIVVSLADVHNYKLSASTKAINNLRNKGGYIPVLLCPFVYGLVVLYWLEFSIFLFHKEEISCIG